MERAGGIRVRWLVIAISLCVLVGLLVRHAARNAASPVRDVTATAPPIRVPPSIPATIPDTAPARGPIELRGQVTHEDGSPYVGVLVVTECEPPRLRMFPRRRAMRILGGSAEQHSVSIRTDLNGSFSCPGLRAGSVAIACEVAGGTRLLASCLPVPSVGDLKLQIAAPSGVIEGRVVSAVDSRPIPGAQLEVRIRYPRDQLALVEIRADASLALRDGAADQQTVDALVQALDWKHALVRKNAAEALGTLGIPTAVPPLMALLLSLQPASPTGTALIE